MAKSSATSTPSFPPLKPDDYSHSPVHYAVVLSDHTTLSRIVATLPRLADPTQIHTESDSLSQERTADQISSVFDRHDLRHLFNPSLAPPPLLGTRLRPDLSLHFLCCRHRRRHRRFCPWRRLGDLYNWEGGYECHNIGYAFAPKKEQTFIQPSLLHHASRYGIDFVPISILDSTTTAKTLIEQGPFNCRCWCRGEKGGNGCRWRGEKGGWCRCRRENGGNGCWLQKR